METQLAGRRFDHVPADLAAPLRKLAESPSPSPAALCLALRLGSSEAWPKLTALAKNHSAPLVDRLKAIRALSEAGPSKTADDLLPLVDKHEPDAIADAVLTALGHFNEESIGQRLLERGAICPSRREKVVDALVSRRAWTHQLLAAVAAGRVDPKIVSVDQVRHMLLHKDPDIARDVTARWGSIRETTPREKQGRINAISIMLSKGPGHPQNGHSLFVGTPHLPSPLRRRNQIGPISTSRRPTARTCACSCRTWSTRAR